jgi:hypothetical protein
MKQQVEQQLADQGALSVRSRNPAHCDTPPPQDPALTLKTVSGKTLTPPRNATKDQARQRPSQDPVTFREREGTNDDGQAAAAG